MGRCQKCDHCLAALEYKAKNKGKSNRKKVKQFENTNACKNPIAPKARHTQNARNPLSEFCEGLNVGDNLIVRVSNEEKAANPD